VDSICTLGGFTKSNFGPSVPIVGVERDCKASWRLDSNAQQRASERERYVFSIFPQFEPWLCRVDICFQQSVGENRVVHSPSEPAILSLVEWSALRFVHSDP